MTPPFVSPARMPPSTPALVIRLTALLAGVMLDVQLIRVTFSMRVLSARPTNTPPRKSAPILASFSVRFLMVAPSVLANRPVFAFGVHKSRLYSKPVMVWPRPSNAPLNGRSMVPKIRPPFCFATSRSASFRVRSLSKTILMLWPAVVCVRLTAYTKSATLVIWYVLSTQSACALSGATKGTAVAAKASASTMRSAFCHIETRVFIMPAILQQSGNWLRCARFARRRP